MLFAHTWSPIRGGLRRFAGPRDHSGRTTSPGAAVSAIVTALLLAWVTAASADLDPKVATTPPPGAAAVAAPAPAVEPPADLAELGAWLEYKHASHRHALPDEARLFYRRGMLAHADGNLQQAMHLLRGAAELDPTFVTPHLTLAAWALTRDPTQALLRYAGVIELVRRSFVLQIELAANLLFFTLHGLFVGLLATSLIVIGLHHAELRHIWQERLSLRLLPASARMWAWVLLLVPFVAGVGIALPAVMLMGMLWPLLRVRERALFAAMALALVAAPFSGHVLGRLATPLREDRAPLFGVTALPEASWTASGQAAIARRSELHPDNPFLLFGLGWMARLGGDLSTAESAYRRALNHWPQDARVLNNLANVLVAQGNTAPAIDLYRAAMAADPQNAAAPFNLSLLYTRQFEYRAATEVAARASALDFELVKSQQALGTEDGVLPMADQWFTPATLWATVLEPDAATPHEAALPPAWHGRIETSGPLFSLAALLLAVGSAVLGTAWQRSIPLRPCRNCGRVVCRRCALRRRELALCPPCAQQEAQAESPEFARVLLGRLRSRSARRHTLVRTTLATLIPGYGLLTFHRVFRAVLMMTGVALLTASSLGVTAPFSYQTWPGLGTGTVSPALPIAGWCFIYINSLLGYFARTAREAKHTADLAAPVRSRPIGTHRITAKAA